MLADHPSAGIGSGLTGPINTVIPDTLPRGKWSASLRIEYIDFDEISDSALTEFSEQGEDVHSTGSLLKSGTQYCLWSNRGLHTGYAVALCETS